MAVSGAEPVDVYTTLVRQLNAVLRAQGFHTDSLLPRCNVGQAGLAHQSLKNMIVHLKSDTRHRLDLHIAIWHGSCIVIVCTGCSTVDEDMCLFALRRSSKPLNMQVVLGGVYLLMPGTAKVYRELQEYLLRNNPSKSSVIDGLDTFSRYVWCCILEPV